MKVLFAVSNESISESIVKKYQKDFKEIISYKNVYYFNAILKEIEKDKSYDRIVISEDLEPFANSNYDVIDKFILGRLETISVTLSEIEGKNIPIVLICTDRRTKSSEMISKFFDLKIYNALIGSDRKIDEVCKLIARSRSKDEARQYYNISTVEPEEIGADDVSELEVQNILIHYNHTQISFQTTLLSLKNIVYE